MPCLCQAQRFGGGDGGAFVGRRFARLRQACLPAAHARTWRMDVWLVCQGKERRFQGIIGSGRVCWWWETKSGSRGEVWRSGPVHPNIRKQDAIGTNKVMLCNTFYSVKIYRSKEDCSASSPAASSSSEDRDLCQELEDLAISGLPGLQPTMRMSLAVWRMQVRGQVQF
jgi:hypothetical protein